MDSPLIQLSKHIKVLSIQQPWAWLIISGHKDIENRSWKTSYRGPLYIHAGKKFDYNNYIFLINKYKNIKFPSKDEFKFGGIIGIVDLLDCTEYHPSNWFEKIENKEKTYAWILTNPRKTNFYPLRGQQGLFNINNFN